MLNPLLAALVAVFGCQVIWGVIWALPPIGRRFGISSFQFQPRALVMLWRVGFLLSSLIFGVAGIVVLLADIPFFIDLAVILFFGAAIFLLAATVLLSSKYTRIDD